MPPDHHWRQKNYDFRSGALIRGRRQAAAWTGSRRRGRQDMGMERSDSRLKSFAMTDFVANPQEETPAAEFGAKAKVLLETLFDAAAAAIQKSSMAA